MADISALYPQPQQQQQGQTNFLSDPARAIGMIGELQRIGIINQQAPALGQQPAASLQGQNIANQTAQLEQQEAARKMVWGAFGNSLNGMDNPTPEDVHNITATLARAYPQIATQYPNIFNSASDTLLGPGGVKKNSAILMNSVMSPSDAASPTNVGVTPQGQTIAGTKAGFNVKAAGGPVVTQPPPGSEASATAMQGDLIKAGSFSQDMYPWTQALAKLKSLGPGATGPGSEGRQELESFVYGLAPQISQYLGIDPDKIKNYADLNKYLTQGMQQRAQNLGPHTNEGLSTAVTGSPNVKINDMSVDELIKSQILLRRMEQAQTLQAAKAGPVGYTGAKGSFASSQDPRAYGIDMMEPAQVQQLQKTLKGTERAKFNSSLQSAINSGVITPPGQ